MIGTHHGGNQARVEGREDHEQQQHDHADGIHAVVNVIAEG